jgi:hypothetical protein
VDLFSTNLILKEPGVQSTTLKSTDSNSSSTLVLKIFHELYSQNCFGYVKYIPALVLVEEMKIHFGGANIIEHTKLYMEVIKCIFRWLFCRNDFCMCKYYILILYKQFYMKCQQFVKLPYIIWNSIFSLINSQCTFFSNLCTLVSFSYLIAFAETTSRG